MISCPRCQTIHSETDDCPGCLLQLAITSATQVRCPDCGELMETTPGSDSTCTGCGTSVALANDQDDLGSIGHFDLLCQLGRGSFGTVWKARDSELQREVAIKIPNQLYIGDEERNRFLRESRAAAQLNHAHIVQIHEVCCDRDETYIVGEFVDGGNLAEQISHRSFTAREAAEICAMVAEALEHAHLKGVIHRDLKPSNILMDSNGQPHVTDFGLAKWEGNDVTMTAEGEILGTPAYMPPEQAAGQGDLADARSDIYSLGVILFEIITGEQPFRGSHRRILDQVVHDEPPRMRKFRTNVDRDLETICQKCMEKQPELRFQSGAELAADLRRYLNGEPIKARPIGMIGRTIRWTRRKPVAAALAITLFFLVGTLSVGGPVVAYREGSLRRAAERASAAANREKTLSSSLGDLLQSSLDKVAFVLSEEIDHYDPLVTQVLGNVVHETSSDYRDMIAHLEKQAGEYAGLETGRTYQAYLCRTLLRRAQIETLAGKQSEAIATYSQAVSIYEELIGGGFADSALLGLAARALYSKAWASRLNGDRAGAVKCLERALVLVEMIQPLGGNPIEERADIHHVFAILHLEADRYAKAAEHCKLSLDLRSKLNERQRATFSSLHTEAKTLNNLGLAYSALHQLDASREAYDQSIRTIAQLKENSPTPDYFEIGEVQTRGNIARMLRTHDRFDEALTVYDEVCQATRRLVHDHDRSPRARLTHRNAYAGRAITLRRLNQPLAAASCWLEALRYNDIDVNHAGLRSEFIGTITFLVPRNVADRFEIAKLYAIGSKFIQEDARTNETTRKMLKAQWTKGMLASIRRLPEADDAQSYYLALLSDPAFDSFRATTQFRAALGAFRAAGKEL